MVTLFVLDVEEFLPIAKVAAQDRSIKVSGPNALGYYRLEGERIQLKRKDLGFKHALWNGILTGGFIGKVSTFDSDRLEIESL
jgi:hypothetical protein